MRRSERRFSFNWASAPDEGEAAAAVSEITNWLSEQSGRDWTGVLTKLRDQMTLLFIDPLIRNDPEARRILESFLDCEDFEEINRVCDELGARVAVLVALRGGARSGLRASDRDPRAQLPRTRTRI